MNSRKRRLAVMESVALISLILPAGTLLAQQPAAGAADAAPAAASEGALQEVVVTAERRATNIQTTPISISAISGDQLASKQLSTISDLQKSVPNMQVLDAGTYDSINIRGIGNTAITPSIVPGVAVTHDGLLSDETIFIGEPFFDIADVEVLRGPQGTLVPASSTGGAVEITSVNPNFRGINGYGEVQFGNYHDQKVDGAINLPISATLAARLAFNEERQNSFYKNQTWLPGPAHPPGDPGSIHNQNARLSLLWQPSDNFQALLKAELNYANYMGIGGEPNQNTFHAVAGQRCPDGSAGPVCHSLFYNYSTHVPFVTNYNLPLSGNTALIDRYSLDLHWTLAGGVVLRSLTGYQHLDGGDQLQDDDFSSANFQIHTKDVGPNDNYYSEDLSLTSPTRGKINWIVGADWFYRTTPVEDFTLDAVGPIVPVNPNNPWSSIVPVGAVPTGALGTRFTALSVVANQRTEGLYGNVNWNITDTLQLQVGARGNWDENYSDGGYPGWFAGAPANTGIVLENPAATGPGTCGAVQPGYNCVYLPNLAHQSDSVPTGKIDLNWTPIAGQYLYVFWARGYKTGGVLEYPNNPAGFLPEKVDDYELGWKSTDFENHLQTSIGGYYMRYADMQLPTLNPPTGRTAVGNVPGVSTIEGIELTATGRMGGFQANFSASLNHSKLGNMSEVASFALPAAASGQIQCAPGQTTACFNYAPYVVNVSGEQNPYTPKFTADLSLQYRFVMGDGGLTPLVDFNYTGAQYTSIYQGGPYGNYYELGARHLLNASLTYDNGPWQVEAYCDNCNNQTYVVGSGGVSVGDVWYYGNPMTMGVRLRRSF